MAVVDDGVEFYDAFFSMSDTSITPQHDWIKITMTVMMIVIIVMVVENLDARWWY